MPESEFEIIEIEGSLEKIIFHNELNGYCVCLIRCDQSDIVAVGTLPQINEGEYIKLKGHLTYHDSYGEQFKIVSFEKSGYKSTEGIIQYLNQGFLKGIGPIMAEKIVDEFGLNTLEIMKYNPRKLAKIKGITIDKAHEYAKILCSKENFQNLFLYLSKYDISANSCVKINNYLGDDSLALIKKNPYLLIETDIPIKFRIIDKIAKDNELEEKSDDRITGALYSVLKEGLNQGHTCLYIKTLFKEANKLLGLKLEIDTKDVEHVKNNQKFYYFEENEYVALRFAYNTEKEIAKSVKGKFNEKLNIKHVTKEEFLSYISSDYLTYDNYQIDAMLNCVNNNISIITGGPGTGKTTILSILCKYFLNNNKKIELAAPTGRAAKRMNEITGIKARTIHRLLEFMYKSQFNEYDFIFQKNNESPIEADVIIIDESSMIDIFLMNSLLQAVSVDTQIIFIGDANQLPAVGAGNVFSDFITSGLIPCYKLEKVYRQKSGGLIAQNSHNILNGSAINFEQRKDSECIYFEKHGDENKMNAVQKLYCEILFETYGYDIYKDVQILTPTKKGLCGTINLNEILQKRLNNQPESVDATVKKSKFQSGDKVIVVKNNYEIEWVLKDNPKVKGKAVLNGEIGFVSETNIYNNTVTVILDDERLIHFNSSEMDNIEPAYAITVHKSQGSEYKVVVLVLPDAPKILMNKNLLYTAFSRAKEKIFVVSDNNIVNFMVSNERVTKRYTLLAELLGS